jgi:hypothetical protein
MTSRTARGNRIGLGVVGVLLLAAGGYALARSLGAFGREQADAPVYSERTASWIHAQQPWIWITLAALGVIVALLALRWLLVQLRTERLGRIAMDTGLDTALGADPDAHPDDAGDVAAGRTALPTSALTAAIGQEIDSYPGVRAVTVHVAGRPDRPELRLEVTIDADADPARIRTRIVDEAISHARAALDTQFLPTQLLLAVNRPSRNVRTYI